MPALLAALALAGRLPAAPIQAAGASRGAKRASAPAPAEIAGLKLRGPGGVWVQAPPGWSPAPLKPGGRGEPSLIMRGPKRQSFVLEARRGRSEPAGRVAMREQLFAAVAKVNRQARLSLVARPGLQLMSLPNGAVVEYVLASQPGRPYLAIGVCRFRGREYLVTLVSPNAETVLRFIAASLSSDREPYLPSLRPPAPGFPWGAAVVAGLAGLALAGAAVWTLRRRALASRAED